MTNATIAFLLALGSSAWIYSKLNRSTGGNTNSSLIASAIIGVIIFVVSLGVFNMIAK